MEKDIREEPLYKEVEEHYRKIFEPAFGRISAANAPQLSPDGQSVAFTGSKLEKLEGTPTMRVCTVPASGGEVEEVTGGPNNDQAPQWSPDGSRLAFLSDRKEKRKFDLYLLDEKRVGEAMPTPQIEETAEYLSWSPDGRFILLGVAGRGADLAGIQGSGTTKNEKKELPSWMPSVDSGPSKRDFRRLYRYEVAKKKIEPVSREGLNVWEAVWAGPDCVAAIVSEDPSENAWYSAPLALIDLHFGKERVVYRSDWQLGLPAASLSGKRLAVVEALCSDRAVIAGDVLLVEPETGAVQRLDTRGVDVTRLIWRDEDHLMYAGLRGVRSVVGEYDATTGKSKDVWTPELSIGSFFYPDFSPLPDGSFVAVVDSFRDYPEVVLIKEGRETKLTSLRHQGSDYARSLMGKVEEISWKAGDGLEIEGLLLSPDSPGPQALIVNIHGGPTGAFRPRWLGAAMAGLLLGRGYAILYPNPRGSSGRGQEFARLEYGDPGGAETGDTLAGIDMLIAKGIADGKRLGVMGGSHGGFMTSWMVTQTDRFGAAVAISPVTDWYSEHHTSNIGRFCTLFLQDEPSNRGGKYFERSPIVFAGNVKTPTLQTAGSQDRCTPPGQAQEFHQALLEHGVESEVVIYPEEGHGVRQFPAAIDSATRIIDWFDRHLQRRD